MSELIVGIVMLCVGIVGTLAYFKAREARREAKRQATPAALRDDGPPATLQPTAPQEPAKGP